MVFELRTVAIFTVRRFLIVKKEKILRRFCYCLCDLVKDLSKVSEDVSDDFFGIFRPFVGFFFFTKFFRASQSSRTTFLACTVVLILQKRFGDLRSFFACFH